jgi:hypothetical protein
MKAGGSVTQTMLFRWAFLVALALFACGVPSVAEAEEEPNSGAECRTYFGVDYCPAEIPTDAAARARVRAFCGALKEAADAVLSGARPGFRMQSGEDMWQGEVSEHRVMWGNVEGRGLYTYDGNATDPRQRYELAFFFPGVSVAELREGLAICPAFFSTATGTASTPVQFRRRPNEGEVEMYVSAEARQYNPETRSHESGARISLLRQ